MRQAKKCFLKIPTQYPLCPRLVGTSPQSQFLHHMGGQCGASNEMCNQLSHVFRHSQITLIMTNKKTAASINNL